MAALEGPSDTLMRWQEYAESCLNTVESVQPWLPHGRLTRVAGLVMEAVGIKLPVGASCQIVLPNGHSVEAEVVGFNGDRLFLMPVAEVYGLEPGASVVAYEDVVNRVPYLRGSLSQQRRIEDHGRQVAVGPLLLGRVLDGLGRPLDRLGTLQAESYVPLFSRPFNPLDRVPVSNVLDVGVRAINALLTVGRGQRLGLFAGSGVGKSVLLGMMARYTTADVVVVGLIGERGREVKDFIENILGEEGLSRSVVVAAPADTPPLLRLHGAAYATAIAEYYRDQGRDVLLIMDSLSRYAMAQREIALAIGEPPATKGYPPSVFAKLPALVERAGNGREGGGSITAFYTVLSEGDDQQDPIADNARAILDGHIVLSRQLSDAGHYPAIDIEQSISRVMTDIIEPYEYDQVRRFKQLYSRYQRSRDLINVGAYVRGSDPLLDEAIARMPAMEAFLQQGIFERESYEGARMHLAGLFSA
ncbi:flagellar protein export ATPase FliI [Chitinimonas sp. BJB300]|uniref:flagellar protein export ATPase FliI n=1 Tax=Chitinimonas sp. BJB300 TaxID=1559339 RepID=UPI000C0E479D|nr:flagellar protein export ATPase FliI [Chitinimonas sp. BJB300]PHV13093.1 flagellar protein export ATPase FliI [Chitinimonas sp. BJB300]TSJ84690.1 flagellar protein export ATPase FliI [Chitinimonas sp. BJB300]